MLGSGLLSLSSISDVQYSPVLCLFIANVQGLLRASCFRGTDTPDTISMSDVKVTGEETLSL